MSISDLINKGKEAISNIYGSAQQKYNDYKDANIAFQNLINSSEDLDGLMLCNESGIYNIGRQNKIKSLIPSINTEDINKIDRVIPFDETIISVTRVMEAKNKKTYFFVTTNKGIYLTDCVQYKYYNYSDINVLDIVVSGLMSQNVNFNNRAFNFELTDSAFNDLKVFLTNEVVRNEEIANAVSYLCGKEIKKQYINENNIGVTITKDNLVIVHTGISNEMINKKEIKRIDVLTDNTVIITRGENENKMLSSKQGCYEMTLKIILESREIILPVIPRNDLNTMYMREDTKYNNNLEFCKRIIDELLSKE